MHDDKTAGDTTGVQDTTGVRDILDLLPVFFTQSLRQQLGSEELLHTLVQGYAGRRAVCLRVNTLKASVDEVCQALTDSGIAFEQAPFHPTALQITEARVDALRALDIYSQGKIYLQNFSAQLPALVLKPEAGRDILDMTAAPGGKTTQMAAITAGRAHITACEMSVPRAQKLQHNLQMQGATGVNLMRCDARRLDDFFSFDQILLDAPCTGSGTLDVHDRQLGRTLTPELLKKCMKSQRALLAKAARLLKPGGTLVYATCSVLRQENEDAIEQFLSCNRFELLPVAGMLAGLESLPRLPVVLPQTLCIRPTQLYEGFFVARLRRLA